MTNNSLKFNKIQTFTVKYKSDKYFFTLQNLEKNKTKTYSLLEIENIDDLLTKTRKKSLNKKQLEDIITKYITLHYEGVISPSKYSINDIRKKVKKSITDKKIVIE